ncbi:MAG: hypothetical protein J6L90_02410 [Clostridia bacterium]|nr:hypothetical protein [Clostridia bacterium]
MRPLSCPMCGERTLWKEVDREKKGFSVGKSALGGIIFGPMGLIAGGLGKTRVYYCCGKCGFEHEYKA